MRHNSRRKLLQGGFTLMETSLAMVIIGVGLLAMLDLIAAGTASNVDGVNETMGMNLAKNVRERSLKSTFDQVLAMDDASNSPPLDSRGTALTGFDGWMQAIDVQPVDVRDLTVDNINPTPDVVRVTVRITHHGQPICQLVWYRFRPVS
jgi:prepilin-type N-terminal cleavage/methylation domain-containing protein